MAEIALVHPQAIDTIGTVSREQGTLTVEFRLSVRNDGNIRGFARIELHNITQGIVDNGSSFTIDPGTTVSVFNLLNISSLPVASNAMRLEVQEMDGSGLSSNPLGLVEGQNFTLQITQPAVAILQASGPVFVFNNSAVRLLRLAPSQTLTARWDCENVGSLSGNGRLVVHSQVSITAGPTIAIAPGAVQRLDYSQVITNAIGSYLFSFIIQDFDSGAFVANSDWDVEVHEFEVTGGVFSLNGITRQFLNMTDPQSISWPADLGTSLSISVSGRHRGPAITLLLSGEDDDRQVFSPDLSLPASSAFTDFTLTIPSAGASVFGWLGNTFSAGDFTFVCTQILARHPDFANPVGIPGPASVQGTVCLTVNFT